jgi:hypothetical protein
VVRRRAEDLVCFVSVFAGHSQLWALLGKERLTGKTMGMPPLTALLPSSLAASLSHSFSSPAPSFQLITVAPYSRTWTLSPVGSSAVTLELSAEKLTVACGGSPGVDDSAGSLGLLARSTIVPFLLCLAVWYYGVVVVWRPSVGGMWGEVKKDGGALSEVDD